MDKEERLTQHKTNIPDWYMPNPESHLFPGSRDRFHYDWACTNLEPSTSILDIGVWDGWLDMLLIRKGFKVNGVELIPALGKAALRYAKANGFNDYKVFIGFFNELEFSPDTYDTVIAFEVLEHMDLTDCLYSIEKMEKIVRKSILISLPDQKMEDNPQHLWTPTIDLIDKIFGKKKNLSMTIHGYPGTTIPSNFMIKYEVIK